MFGEGYGKDIWKALRRNSRKLVRVILKCLCDPWLLKQKSDGLGREELRDQKSI